MPPIYLPNLISTLADACSRGCQVIQCVQKKRERISHSTSNTNGNGHGHSDSDTNTTRTDTNTTTEKKNDISVQYKVADDPRSALTEADVASQKVIIHCIRHVWGDDLKIVGEEDDDDDDDDDDDANKDDKNENANANANDEISALFEKYDVDLPTKRTIQKDLFKNTIASATASSSSSSSSSATPSHHNPHHMVELNELCLYIDPMDGTREFVEQRLHNVQCLIGITYMGHPIGGVIGLPFLSFENDKKEKSGTDDGIINVICALYSFDAKNNIVDMIRFDRGSTSSAVTGMGMGTVTGMGMGMVTLDGNKESWLSLEKKTKLEGKLDGNVNVNDTTISKKKEVTVIKVFTGDSNRLPKKTALQYINKLASASSSNDDDNSNNNNNHDANGKISIELCIAGGCGNKILRTIACAASNPEMNAIAVIPPGTSLWDTAAPTAMLRAAQVKYDIVANVTDMFGGQLVYDSTGTKVTNDLGVFVSFGDIAAKYHIELCKSMRSDAIILDSLLRKYWTVRPGEGGGEGEILEEEQVQLRLKNSQMKPQSVDTTRNAKGYVLTCAEIEVLVAEQISLGSCKLIGYAMPEKTTTGSTTTATTSGVVDENVHELQLFWTKCANENGEKRRCVGESQSPPEVVQLMVNGSRIRIALCE